MVRPIETLNRCVVVAHGDRVAILHPPAPREYLTPDDALNLAAWLVLSADGAQAGMLERFQLVLDACANA